MSDLHSIVSVVRGQRTTPIRHSFRIRNRGPATYIPTWQSLEHELDATHAGIVAAPSQAAAWSGLVRVAELCKRRSPPVMAIKARSQFRRILGKHRR
jgi:hypothetical protein